MKSIKAEDKDCPKFDFDKYLIPFWEKGNIIYNESVFPLENKEGGDIEIKLMFTPLKIISVRNAMLTQEYDEGTDWRLENGRLIIPQSSKIETTEYNYYYPTGSVSGHVFEKRGGGYVRLFCAPEMHKSQIVVTYIHEDEWDGPIPEKKGNLLSNFHYKLNNGRTVRIVFFGDSITAGGDSSGSSNSMIAPMVPTWPQLVAMQLKKEYGDNQIEYINTAVGGTDIVWARESIKERVIDYDPDLVVFGFGMNNAYREVEEYKRLTQEVIAEIQGAKQDCDILLVAPMLPNYEAITFCGNQKGYRGALLELEEEGVVVADITEQYEYLLTRKRFCDITGNNINHCNDFLARYYAHTILRTIEK